MKCNRCNFTCETIEELILHMKMHIAMENNNGKKVYGIT